MTDSKTLRTEVVIVGAGPIGIETAVGLGRHGIDYQFIEAGDVGATMGWWAPETRFFSSPERIEICGVPLIVPGQEKATGEQYRDYLRGVVRQFGVSVRTHERVETIERQSDGFIVKAIGPGGEREIACDKVVLAIGNMHAPRLIGVEGEDLPHVHHYFMGPHHYFGRRVLIVGGKNSACEAALRLYRAGVDVTVSYRRSTFDEDRVKYWIRPELEWLIERERVGFLPETVPARVGEGFVDLDSTKGGGSIRFETDFVLMLTGYVQDQSLFDQLGIERIGEEQRPHYDHDTMETNVPGVYVAGTACGGSQKRARVFIENSHVHAERIVAAIANPASTHPGQTPEAPTYGTMEES